MTTDEAVLKPTSRDYAAAFVVLLIAVINYMDRALLSILQVPVKADLGVSDSEIGILTGFAFAVFYTSMGVPIARLADRITRKHVLAGSLLIWTLSTAACGFAHDFWSLLFFRMGVALGEAGAASTSISLLVDFFPRRYRPNALAGWAVATSSGVMLSFFAGGLLAQYFSWRLAFFILGFGGLLLVPLVAFWMREPERGRYDKDILPTTETLPFFQALGALWKLKTFRYYMPGAALVGYVQYATTVWTAPFYVRLHEMSIGTVATYLACAIGISGAVGSVASIWLVKRLQHRDIRWYLRLPAIACVIVVPTGLIQYFVPNLTVSLIVGVVPAMMLQVFLAPGNVVAQSIVAPNLRALITSVVAVAGNLFGMGLGPLVVGILSDVFIREFGMTHDSLRYAISLQLLVSLVAAWCFYKGSLHLREEMRPLHD